MDHTESPPSRHDAIGNARHDVLPIARATRAMHSMMVPRWQRRLSRPSHGTAAIGAQEASHRPPIQLLTRLHHSTGCGDHRRPRHHGLLSDAARDCVKRSMTSGPCRRRRGQHDEYHHRLIQPAGAAAAAASQPTARLTNRWRSEPARRRVKCRAIYTSSGRPRVDERSRDGRPAASGRHRARSGAAWWPQRAASEPLDDFHPGGWEGTRRRRRS